MRHVKRYSELFEAQMELTEKQTRWLDGCTNGKWELNEVTGLVDVKGSFDCSGQNLRDFKGVRFGVVSDQFICSDNPLESLEGCPQRVVGYFSCSNTLISSLKGAPESTGRSFDCSNCSLTTLEGAPRSVGGNFYCYHNFLTSLEGAPEGVGLDFYCYDNSLTSLKGAPQRVLGCFSCLDNSITSLEGLPARIGGNFYCAGNPVSERTLNGICKKMRGGLSWPEALSRYWRFIRTEEDKALLAVHNPKLSLEDRRGYDSLLKFRGKII